MPDLRTRFRSLDRDPVPDLWGEVERRAAGSVVSTPLRQVAAARTVRQELPVRARPAAARRLLLLAVILFLAVASLGAAIIVGTAPPPTRDPSLPQVGPGLRLVATGSLTTPRCGHTGVRLADGRVLIVGGWSAPGRLATTAELYDPVTGTFRQVTGETTGGDGMSATLLADGRVLIAGGRTTATIDTVTDSCALNYDGGKLGDETASAFIYDPATDRIEPTGALTVPRSGHVAVLLDDGHVLVAGGNGVRDDGTQGSLSTAELYDPASRDLHASRVHDRERGWYRALSLAVSPGATRLTDGRVVVTGGHLQRRRSSHRASCR